MYDHLGLKVQDLAASVAFYAAVLKPLGHELCAQDAGSAGLGPRGAPALWLYAGRTGKNPGTHVAFKAASRAAVEAFHKAGLKAGGRENGKPGLRADYSPTYYAAFLLDPDGNNVEAVWMG
jgi:catechol 2,3-dioxygenase-like lactoylglutathione lyase family enzyme